MLACVGLFKFGIYTSLHRLKLYNNTDAKNEWFTHLDELEVLDIDGCPGIGAIVVRNNSKLRELYVMNCPKFVPK